MALLIRILKSDCDTSLKPMSYGYADNGCVALPATNLTPDLFLGERQQRAMRACQFGSV
jgi:hypothetical protein